MVKQLEELKAKMERSSMALVKFERELDVINPEEKTNILSSRLLQLNTEYTNAQGDRVRKEAAYNATRSETVAAAMVSSQSEELGKLQDRLNQARQKVADVEASMGRITTSTARPRTTWRRSSASSKRGGIQFRNASKPITGRR